MGGIKGRKAGLLALPVLCGLPHLPSHNLPCGDHSRSLPPRAEKSKHGWWEKPELSISHPSLGFWPPSLPESFLGPRLWAAPFSPTVKGLYVLLHLEKTSLNLSERVDPAPNLCPSYRSGD